MSLFDTRTVFLLCGVMGGLMALVLYSLKRNYPPSIKGLGEWSGALMAMFLAGILTAGRGRFPDLISVSLANVFYFGGLYCGYVGTKRFFGRPQRHMTWLVVLAAIFCVHLWFTFVRESQPARLILVNVMGAVFMGAQALVIFGNPPRSFAKSLTLGALVSAAALQILRVGLAVMQSLEDNIIGPSPIHQIYATGFALSVLIYSIGLVLMASDMLRAELELLATRDSLTDALTRRHWNTLCASELERCKRNGRDMAILALDLDHFKAVNDTYGHQAGDKVLVNFVKRINRHLRQNDRLSRFGGEEFILLLPETAMDQARNVAERIRFDLASASDEPNCTVSIGVAIRRGEADTVQTIVARADAAMYRAKEGGRNRVESD